MCFNKKVIAGLAVVAVGVLLLAPGLAGAVLPLLLFAACPLSMVFMMNGMQNKDEPESSQCEAPADTAQIEAPKVAVASSNGELRELRAELARLRAELHERNDAHA